MPENRERLSPNRKTALKIAVWSVSFLWIGFCFFLSWQSGRETANLSMALAETVERILSRIGIKTGINIVHSRLRRAAHFGVFFVVGVLLFISFLVTLKRGRKNSAFSLLFASAAGAAVAVIAEVVKPVVPGRHLTWSETWLNVVGIVCGAAVSFAVNGIVSRRSAKTAESGNGD